jgi:hypothetical protein
MTNFLFLLSITFTVVISAGLVINYCKRRAAATSHGLTGMCHKNGGSMCSCCGTKYTASPGSQQETIHNC